MKINIIKIVAKILLILLLVYSVISTKYYIIHLHYLINEDHKIISKLIENDDIFIKSLRVNGIDKSALENAIEKWSKKPITK